MNETEIAIIQAGLEAAKTRLWRSTIEGWSKEERDYVQVWTDSVQVGKPIERPGWLPPKLNESTLRYGLRNMRGVLFPFDRYRREIDTEAMLMSGESRSDPVHMGNVLSISLLLEDGAEIIAEYEQRRFDGELRLADYEIRVRMRPKHGRFQFTDRLSSE